MGSAETPSSIFRNSGMILAVASKAALTIHQTEILFHTYSQFASVPNVPPKPTEDERQTETKIEETLEKVHPLTPTAVKY